MAKTTVKTAGARRGRPALKPGSPKRSSFNTRLRDETKQKLEAEARISGRSLSEEIEFRLEQSFRDEDALIETLGGRNTYDVLRMFGSVAAHIQTRTGKTTADWKTGLAISRAWRRLILDWMTRPPPEWTAELERLFDNMPDAPVPPEPPEAPARGGLLDISASEEEWEAYRAEFQNYEKGRKAFLISNAEHQKAIDQIKAAQQKMMDDVRNAAAIGEEALGLLSDQEK